MDKKRVRVQIEGRNYVIVTEDDDKYVHSVADEITEKIRKAARSKHSLDTRDCAIYAALDLCDDRNKAVRKNKDVIGKADKIIRTANDLNKQCAEYKDRLTETINENTRLTKRVQALEKQIKTLIDENKRLSDSVDARSDKPREKSGSKGDNTENQLSLFGKKGK